MFIASWSRARAELRSVPAVRWLVMLAGAAALLRLALDAYGGWDKVWCFAWMDQHRSTAMMMLTGTLRLHSGLSLITNDEQVYNGAGYTNWGYGVPLLELPFHAVARHLSAFPGGFFPDRAIFFFYMSALPPVLWGSLWRAMGSGQSDARWAVRAVCSWVATFLVLTCALFPLMAYRFFVYEQTLSYLVVCELYALCAYLWLLRRDGVAPICALALAAGLGLLIRATGLVYLGVWFGLVVLERRSRARVLAFLCVAAPFAAFCLYSNFVRSGSPFSFGYANSNPWVVHEIPIQRFGSQCVDSLGHGIEAAWALFSAFFFSLDRGMTPHLTACHFGFELQEAAHSPFWNEPFFGMGVLGALTWTSTHHVVRRERRLAVYVPYLAMAFLFLAFVLRGTGFAWRYAADFWPLLWLVAAQYTLTLPARARRFVFDWPAAVFVAGVAALSYTRHVAPERPSIRTLDARGVAAMEMPQRFQLARYGTDPAFPARVACGDSISWPYDGGAGWAPDCTVDTFTNIYLGVRSKADAHYELRLDTAAMDAPSIRVYVNGSFYTARRDGSVYRAEVKIDCSALTTPTVMATVEWTRGFEAPGGKLLAVELVVASAKARDPGT
jgi:hypothetical protein